MFVLFDQGVPLPISRHLTGHAIGVSADLGWDRLQNGDLIDAAEKAGYEVLLTTDKTFTISRTSQAERLPSLSSRMRNGPLSRRMCKE